jgi:hypothetical protein
MLEVSIHLPGKKLIMAEEFKTKTGKVLPVGLMLSVRALELTIHKKKIRLLAIRNKAIIDTLYTNIPEETYVRKYTYGSGRESINSVFYEFNHDELDDFLNHANFKDGTDIYNLVTNLPKQ